MSMKNTRTKLSELKAYEKREKKRSFFGSLFKFQPKMPENKSSVRLKGIYPKRDEPLPTISSSVRQRQSSESDIYEEIQLPHGINSGSESESGKNKKNNFLAKAKFLPTIKNFEESSDEKVEGDEEANNSIEKKEPLSQNNSTIENSNYHTLVFKKSEEKAEIERQSQTKSQDNSSKSEVNNEVDNDTTQKPQTEVVLNNLKKFDAMIKSQNGNNFTRNRSKSLHPNFNSSPLFIPPKSEDKHVSCKLILL